MKGNHWSTLGHHQQDDSSSINYIYPEEALFLIDRGILQLIIKSDDNRNDDVSLCSLEKVYHLFLQQEHVLSLETFQVYMYLKRLGYILIRYIPPFSSTSSLLSYKIYKPNSKFRKSTPGSPSFYLIIQR